MFVSQLQLLRSTFFILISHCSSEWEFNWYMALFSSPWLWGQKCKTKQKTWSSSTGWTTSYWTCNTWYLQKRNLRNQCLCVKTFVCLARYVLALHTMLIVCTTPIPRSSARAMIRWKRERRSASDFKDRYFKTFCWLSKKIVLKSFKVEMSF